MAWCLVNHRENFTFAFNLRREMVQSGDSEYVGLQKLMNSSLKWLALCEVAGACEFLVTEPHPLGTACSGEVI
jgi:hypothetical protein